jgi:hypothetical protein
MLILALAAAGCASHSGMQQQQAFLAGQNATLRQEQATPSVTVIGPVQNSRVPWVVGLTLAQAVATADYIGTSAPRSITLTRNGEKAVLDAKVLLQGADVPLEAGDIVEIEP